MLIAYAELTDLCERVLRGVGVPADDAAVQAWALVEADARDHPSHGVQRLPTIIDRILAGLAVAPADITAQWATPAVVRIDGGRGLGPVVGLRAVDLVGTRAAETGIAIAAISNTNHIGTLALYADRLAGQGPRLHRHEHQRGARPSLGWAPRDDRHQSDCHRGPQR